MSDDTTTACPHCDNAVLKVRVTAEQTYKCNECCATFNDPKVRERRNSTVSAETMIERAVRGD